MIPALLLSGEGLVKTVKFSGPKYLGDPINVVKIFNDKEADELFLLDITASREHRGPNVRLVEQIVSEAFMPVCYGGGVTRVEDARQLLKVGVEKVLLNTAALANPRLLRQLADAFGAQCVVASVDVKKTWLGARYEVFSHARARVPEPNPVRWAQILVEHGAGEVVVTSVDRDGTMQGFDLNLLAQFDGRLSVPLIAAGGAGSVDDMCTALRACRLSGLAVGARFVYQSPHRAVLISYLSAAEQARVQAAARR